MNRRTKGQEGQQDERRNVFRNFRLVKSSLHSQKSKEKKQTDAVVGLCRITLPKNSGAISEKSIKHDYHLQWDVQLEMKQSLRCGKTTLWHSWIQQKTTKLVIL